jgi:hypothetical protein
MMFVPLAFVPLRRPHEADRGDRAVAAALRLRAVLLAVTGLLVVLSVALRLALVAVAGLLMAVAVALGLALLAVARLLRLRCVLPDRLGRSLLLVSPTPVLLLVAVRLVAVRLGRLVRSPPV